MRLWSVGGTFLVLSTAASVASAVPDTTGNNIALSGSDTVFDVTQEVLTSCPSTVGSGDTYVGGGSAVGAGQIDTNQQQISPMSRALQSSEFCGISLDLDNNPATPPVSVQGTTEGLMIALDSLGVFANTTTSCAGNGINQTGTITVADASGNPVTNCTGCTAGTNSYVLASSLDVLKIIYAGAMHDGTIDCSNPVRSSLVNNWASVFAATCAGQAACNQLKHAWRRADLSDTTDAFLTALGISGRGIGSLPAAPNATRNRNPFCNSLDANPTSTRAKIPSGATAAAPACTTQPLTSASCPNGAVCPAGQLCNPSNNTCVSNTCSTAGCPAGQVCRPDGQCVVATCPSGAGGPYSATLPNTPAANTRGCDGPNGLCTFSFGGSSDFSDLDPIRRTCDATATSPDQACEADGTYGLVTVLFPPNAAGVTVADAYPTTNCDAGSFDLQSTGNTILACPGGPQFLGKCFQPFFTDPTGNHQFNCLSRRSARAFGTPAGTDGRIWNMQVKKADTAVNPPRLAAYVRDANGRFMTQASFRWHVTNTTGAPTCQLADANAQTGCLVNADNCSVGYAGRAANQQAGNQSLLVNNIAPTDQNIMNLVTGGMPVYPFASRLHLATLVGFNRLTGGENELAKCFADNSIVRQAATDHLLVNLPAPGVQCLDYDETLATNASPLPGCGSPTNTDACRLTPPGVLADAIGAGAVPAGGTAANLILHPLSGTTKDQAQAVVNANCISCHSGASAAAGLDLTDLTSVVGAASTESSKPIIAAGDPTNSYLVDKIEGITQTVGTGVSAGSLAAGSRMPNALPQLNPSDINIILGWISGAFANYPQWQSSMIALPLPGAGCFTATYPNIAWQPVPCGPPPASPGPLAATAAAQASPGIATIGGQHYPDYYAEVPNAAISGAVGSFPVAVLAGALDPLDDQFSLQLNTNTFQTSACDATSHPYPRPCVGVQQFVFSGDGEIQIQYWLLHAGECPPSGFRGLDWRPFSSQLDDGDTNCVGLGPTKFLRNPTPTLPDLARMNLRGVALPGGLDEILFWSTGGLTVDASGTDSVLGLAGSWSQAEFNVFGVSNGAELFFNQGTSILVELQVEDGSGNPPLCAVSDTITGETNNLNVLNTAFAVPPYCCSIPGGILFTESNDPSFFNGINSTCACPPGYTWNEAGSACVCGSGAQPLADGTCPAVTISPTCQCGNCSDRPWCGIAANGRVGTFLCDNTTSPTCFADCAAGGGFVTPPVQGLDAAGNAVTLYCVGGPDPAHPESCALGSGPNPWSADPCLLTPAAYNTWDPGRTSPFSSADVQAQACTGMTLNAYSCAHLPYPPGATTSPTALNEFLCPKGLPICHPHFTLPSGTSPQRAAGGYCSIFSAQQWAGMPLGPSSLSSMTGGGLIAPFVCFATPDLQQGTTSSAAPLGPGVICDPTQEPSTLCP
jgi:hypothetical protein